jgi:CDP-diglyceride synthetase
MWLIVQLVILLAVANGTPVLAAKVFGDSLALPLDGNVKLSDGYPLFGPAKTLRGVVLSILVTSLFAPLIGLSWMIGALVASAAMIGDLLSSFLKRRLGLFASSRSVGLDQIPESLLPLVASKLVLPLTIFDIVLATGMFLVSALALSRLLFKLNIRDRPY